MSSVLPPRRLSEPSEPPDPTYSKMRIVGWVPPLVKSLRMRMSPEWAGSWGTTPALWLPGPNEPPASGPTVLLKNQNPIWASPLLSNRSAAKKMYELVPS